MKANIRIKPRYLECIDAINMEERVALFMAECTNNMSKTTYTINSIKKLINEKYEYDINMFCADLLEMGEEDMIEDIVNRAEQVD